MKTVRLSVSVPLDFKRALEAEAKEAGMNMSEFIRYLVYVHRQKKIKQ